MKQFVPFLVALLAPLVAHGGVADRIAAVVNDEIIALSEVYEVGGSFVDQRCPALGETCVTEAELEVLDALIERTLIRQELERLGLQVTAADVDQAIDQTVREYGLEDRNALREQVESSGKRWDQYREELFEFLRTQRFQQRVLAPRVTVTEDEMRDLYQRSARREKHVEVQLEALGIIVPPEADEALQAEMAQQAANLAKAIEAGQIPWEEAVAQYDGADLGVALGSGSFREGQLADPIDEVAFSAPVGEVQEPFRMGNLLVILEVEERGETSGEVLPFEEAQEQLKNQVFQRNLEEAAEEWYQRARREATIDIKLADA